MIIIKKIKMTRYIGMDDVGKEIFDEYIWYADKDVPEVPYYKIKVKIVKTEKRYIHNRPKKKDWLRFFNFGV